MIIYLKLLIKLLFLSLIKESLDNATSIIKDFPSLELDKEGLLMQLSFNEKYIKEFNSSLMLQSLEIIRKKN